MAVKQIRATADRNKRKYLTRNLNIIEKSKGCHQHIATFYGVLLKNGDSYGLFGSSDASSSIEAQVIAVLPHQLRLLL